MHFFLPFNNVIFPSLSSLFFSYFFYCFCCIINYFIPLLFTFIKQFFWRFLFLVFIRLYFLLNFIHFPLYTSDFRSYVVFAAWCFTLYLNNNFACVCVYFFSSYISFPFFFISFTAPKDKFSFNVRLNLISSQPFVQCGQFLDLCYSTRSLTVKVDPTGLPPGVHTAV